MEQIVALIEKVLTFAAPFLGLPPDVTAQGTLGVLVFLVITWTKDHIPASWKNSDGSQGRLTAALPWITAALMTVAWTAAHHGDWKAIVGSILISGCSSIGCHNVVEKAIKGK